MASLINYQKVKGVFFSKKRGRWRAQIWLDGKNKHIGVYKTKIEAVRARLEGELFHNKFKEDSSAFEFIKNYKNRPKMQRFFEFLRSENIVYLYFFKVKGYRNFCKKSDRQYEWAVTDKYYITGAFPYLQENERIFWDNINSKWQDILKSEF